MTRLTTSDIHNLGSEIANYNSDLIKKTGSDMRTLVCFASGISAERFAEASRDYAVAVVPITSGQGLIGSFAESVQSIIEFLGYTSFVTEHTDVAGIAEAVERKAHLIFMADDDRFIVFNVGQGFYVDNAQATARGYVAALAHMAQGLSGEDVLVLGAGPVGQGAISFLKELGAQVKVFDIKQEKLARYQNDSQVFTELSLAEALRKYKYILDATPATDFIGFNDLHPEAVVAAPGIPLGLTAEAFARNKDRIVHDPLQLGVATMLAMAL